MKVRITLLAIFAGGCIAPSCGPSYHAPDSCTGASTGAVAQIEIDNQGLPLQPNARLRSVRGGQGASMIVVSLRLSGNVPDCLDQSTRLLDVAGNSEASVPVPLSTFADADGKRTTHDLYLPGVRAGLHYLSVTAGATTLDLPVFIDTDSATGACGVAMHCARACGWGASCQASCAAALPTNSRFHFDLLMACVATSCAAAPPNDDAGTVDGGYSVPCGDLGCSDCVANSSSSGVCGAQTQNCALD